jgi:K+-sensing histidine kinase KdpD
MSQQVAPSPHLSERLPRALTGPRQVVVGLACTAAAAVIRLVLNPWLGEGLPFLTFFPAVAAAAWAGGLRGGITATASSAAISAYFLLEPQESVQVDDAVGLVIFVLASLFISMLGGQLHAARRVAEAQRERAAFLSDASSILSERLDRLATLDSLSRAAVPRFADWCAIDLFDADGRWIDSRIAALDAATVDVANRVRREYPYDPASPAGVPAVFRTGQPEYVLDVPPDFMAVIEEAKLRRLMESLDIRSFISVPLATPTGRRLGVLTVVMSGSGRQFTVEDVATAVDLGRRAGTALDHGTLFREVAARGDELDAIIGALAEPVLIADAEDRIVRANPAGTAVVGPTEGRTLHEVLDGLPPAAGRAAYRAGRDGRFVEPVELDLAPAAGGRALILRDVTAVVETEAARDAFVGMLSHELRTPITTIYGMAQLLRKAGRREPGGELVADLALESERLYRLVEDLLVLSRFERGRLEMSLEPVMANRVVTAAVQRVRELYPRLRLDLAVDPNLPPTSADATYLEQVIRNLASNAVKYAGEDARVVIGIDFDGAAIQLRVDDDGPGIPEDQRERIFELYERLGDAAFQPGAGIGLFVCRRLIEGMGGSISATRSGLGGASFRITLPVIAAELSIEPETPGEETLVGDSA